MGMLRRRTVAAILIVGAIAIVALAAWMRREAARDPIVRRAFVAVPGWPTGTPPLRIVHLTDIHAGARDMPPARLARIVAQVNALRPDIVLLTGDYLSHKYASPLRWSERAALAPLAGLAAPLGTVAVAGNHDHVFGYRTVARALTAAGVTLLANQALRRGPLLLLGADDPVTGHEDMFALSRAAAGQPGVRVLLAHAPLLTKWAPPGTRLYLAGHTHCGQVRLPLWGAIRGRYGDGAAPIDCGIARLGAMTLIVGGGLGTSGAPLRLGAPPDLWLVTMGGAPR